MTYISTLIIPMIIAIILFVGIKEKKDVYDLFLIGAKEGVRVAIKLFPTLIGIFLAIYMLRYSGLIDFLSKVISGATSTFNIPSEIFPLILIKPISGSGAIAIATDIMEHFGVDSNIGRIAAVIMGSSETTFYIIALYTSSIKVKDNRRIFFPTLLADFASVITAIILFL